MNLCIHDFDDAKEESNKVASTNKHCFKINSRSSFASKTKCFQDIQGSGNRLPGNVIDYQKTSLQISFLKGFEI